MAFSTTVDSMPNDPAAYHPHHHRHHHHHHNVHSHSHAHHNHSTHAKKRAAATGELRDRTVVVFDWDDTLCPSSWLHSEDLLPKYRGQQILLTKEQQQILAQIADNVTRLLQKAVSYGPVFVVTAAEYGWVELSCALYLPGVQAILEMSDIHIVSARSWYEQTFGVGGDSASWKLEVMQLIARKCFGSLAAGDMDEEDADAQPESYFNFISVGDSMAERDACHSAADHVAYTFAKTLKFVEHPTTEEIVQQVELTHDSFEQMCGWTSNLDLRLTRAQLAELRCT